MATILVVDDQEPSRNLLGDELLKAGFDVAAACDGDDAWQRFCAQHPDVVVTDLEMPHCDGIELVRRIRAHSDVPVIVFSGNATVESSAYAFKAGADEFISSVDVALAALVSLVREAADDPDERFVGADGKALVHAVAERLSGTSRTASRIRWQVAGLAPLTAPVLVSGETGTGRTTAIDAMHELGATAGGELARIACAGLTPADVEQQLDRAAAVHLEEIEHLAWAAQARLAGRLEARDAAEPRDRDRDPAQARAPGRAEPEARGARVFASTSAPLPSLVRSGGFHPELGRVLMRFHVELPPLRERSEDVGPIARALLSRIGQSVGRGRIQLSAAALAFLEAQRFPENIRQLERLLERGAAYSPSRVIRRDTLEGLMVDLEETIASMRDERTLLERERLLRTLQETGGNITRTAEILGKSRAAIYRLIEKYSIPLTRSG